jgi:hypothetical protein
MFLGRPLNGGFTWNIPYYIFTHIPIERKLVASIKFEYDISKEDRECKFISATHLIIGSHA